jgi:hypothetical protein
MLCKADQRVATDYDTVGAHVEIIVAPLAGWPTKRRSL